jgi:hypothetical protein
MNEMAKLALNCEHISATEVTKSNSPTSLLQLLPHFVDSLKM